MFDIKENLKKLPDCPGVYIHKDKLGQVIYVGKAISLKNRVRQYFQSSKNMDTKVRAMVSQIEEFEYITTGSEMEALILECNLIKKYMPKYNVLLRDDKTYPYIKVTTGEDFPRVLKVRRVAADGGKYFGPYSDAGAVNQIVDLLNSTYALKRCSARAFPKDFRPCLNYHIGQCRGICAGAVSKEEYRKAVEGVLEFLNGRNKGILDYLKSNMAKAAELLDFEQAARFRDAIEAVGVISEKQHVTLLSATDMDIVLAIRGEREHHAVLFFIRDGKLSGRESYPLQAMSEDESSELVAAFIKQYYAEAALIPKEILVSAPLLDSGLIEEYLSGLAGRKVKITVPQKGDKKALLQLAQRDVIEMTKSIDEKARNQRERSMALGSEIHGILSDMGYASSPYAGQEYRIEAYDISNTNGVDTVGAMVVFNGAKPWKKDYRRFKVRTVEGSNDYGSLQEVIYRRFKRAEEGDPGFSAMPDLLFIDGGKAQVSVVQRILDAMKIDLPVAGMAKDDHHRTRALVYVPADARRELSGRPAGEAPEAAYAEIVLKERPLLFKYTGTIQEEVHRFAIDYHKGLRNKRVQVSALDEIDGVGPVKRNALFAHFGSIDSIRSADIGELCRVPGITDGLAKKIREYFN